MSFDATDWWLSHGHAVGRMNEGERILPADLEALAAAARADAIALLRELNDALLPIPDALQARLDAMLDKADA